MITDDVDFTLPSYPLPFKRIYGVWYFEEEVRNLLDSLIHIVRENQYTRGAHVETWNIRPPASLICYNLKMSLWGSGLGSAVFVVLPQISFLPFHQPPKMFKIFTIWNFNNNIYIYIFSNTRLTTKEKSMPSNYL